MANADAANGAAKTSKLSLILIVLLVAMSGAAGFFGWRYFSAKPVKAEAAASVDEAPADEGSEEAKAEPETVEEEHGAEAAATGKPAVQGAIVDFEPFLVNLADKDAFRYLRVTIRLQVANKTAADRIASTQVFTSQIRDNILGILSSKASDDIITAEGKDKLKKEIAEKLNSFLPGKSVKNVFFTDFVVQL